MEKNYRTGPFNYGVSGMIGSNYVTKLRVNSSLFYTKINPFLLTEGIHYSVNKRNVVKGKNYVHFTSFLTYNQLTKIKIMVRQKRLDALKEEIEELQIKITF